MLDKILGCRLQRPRSVPLQLLDAVAGSAVEHSIAVVDPREDQTTSQCLCQFHSQQDGVECVGCRMKRTDNILADSSADFLKINVADILTSRISA